MRIAVAGLALLSMTAVAGATTTGLPGVVPSATWDTFADGSAAAGLQIENASPTSAAGVAAFISTLSLDMTAGSFTGGGDRIYNGNRADSVPVSITINGTANSDIESLYLFVKMTTPDVATGLLRHNFLNVALDGSVDSAATTFNNNTNEDVGGQQMGVIYYEWTGLNIANGENFALTITSPASGHISIDALRLSTVPEPTALGLVGAAGLMALRRRRQA